MSRRTARVVPSAVSPAGHAALRLAAEHHTLTVYKGRAVDGRASTATLSRLVAAGYLDPIWRGVGPFRRVVGGHLNADGRRRLIELDAARYARTAHQISA